VYTCGSDISAAGAARSSGTHVCAGDTEADWITIARREKGTERVEATGGSKGRASTGGGGERRGAAGHQVGGWVVDGARCRFSLGPHLALARARDRGGRGGRQLARHL
jgi:hypothetical protein